MSSDNVVGENTDTKTSGRVKWFNNASGYGFITATDGDKTGEDVFVHHTALETDEQQYKYLVLGEYVEFCWSEVSDKESHKWQACKVTGINGGKLMCETHKEQRGVNEGSVRRPRNNDATWSQGQQHDEHQGQRQGHKFHGGPKSLRDSEGKEWMLVPKDASR
jgi:CspA family cold shock protein